MKQKFFSLILTLELIVSAVPTTHADSRPARGEVEIVVATAITPKDGVGLLITPKGTTEVPLSSIQKTREGLYLVKFSVPANTPNTDSFASAILKSSSGEAAFGDLRSIVSALQRSSVYSQPSCTAPVKDTNVDVTKVGTWETLVSFREQRRKTAQDQLTQLLTADNIETFRKLEKGFGLTRGTAISADLPPVELVDRLSRLLTTLKNYNLSKKQQK